MSRWCGNRRRRMSAVWCLIALAGCEPLFGSRKLGSSDCKPRKLTRVARCTGESTGFQECRFYFRAVGEPDGAWCEALVSSARQQAERRSECDFANAASFQKLDCARFGITGTANCYGCVVTGADESRGYVYAYSADCRRGVEQVTCNFDDDKVAKLLGAIDL